MTQLSTGLTKHLSSLQTTSWEAKLIQPLEIQHLHNANSKMAFPKDLSFHLQSSTYILLTCLLLPNAHKSYADNITITATQCDIQTTKAHIQAYLHTTQYTYMLLSTYKVVTRSILEYGSTRCIYNKHCKSTSIIIHSTTHCNYLHT